MTSNNLIGAERAARRLGVSLYELYELVDRGRVPAYLIAGVLRFRLNELPSQAIETCIGHQASGYGAKPGRSSRTTARPSTTRPTFISLTD